MRTTNGGTVSAEAEAYIIMANALSVPCDGCGQMASPEHIAQRLRRLEWATRYRPVHIQTLLLGGVAPREDAEFLYAPSGEFRGEGQTVLRAVGIETGQPPSKLRASRKPSLQLHLPQERR